MRRIVLPRMRPGDNLVDAFNRLARDLEQQVGRGPSGRPWTVTHGVDTRTLDVSTATLADVAKALGTLITDEQAGGNLG